MSDYDIKLRSDDEVPHQDSSEKLFPVITPRFTLVLSDSTC